MHHAIVICTFGRPEMLRQTLHSVAEQRFSDSLLVVVVEKDAEAPLHESDYPFALRHVQYEGPPSAARQRNMGIEVLPNAVEQVFFLDDDVTLEPGYLEALRDVLDDHSDVGGAGGILMGEGPHSATLLKRLFLLTSPYPGRVLPSGCASFAQSLSASPLAPTQWLSTCSSVYRRSLLDRERFDEAVPGAMLEDLDLSLRVGRSARLVVEPAARLYHHKSPLSRPKVRQYAFMRMVQRYWFVEKNVRHPLRKAAYWWATLGRVAATLFSEHPEAREALQGLCEGIRTVWQRRHPLLQRNRR